MKKINIPKKTKGEFRTIYSPSKNEKQALRDIFPSILTKALNICNLDVCQGFFPNTSPVTNALRHVGYQYTTMMDLKDFFDSINTSHLIGKLSDEELALVLVDGAPRQGLPTSPIVANMAASDLDKSILNVDNNIVYTRYADDLAFSYNSFGTTEHLKTIIPILVKDAGFNINEKKTRTMSAKNGRRIITGVAVDDFIHPTRRMKRKMRAALHQGNSNQYNGLKEWCKMKRPNALVKIEIEELKQAFPHLLREWGNSAYNSEIFPLD
jgi:hypothetical protein